MDRFEVRMVRKRGIIYEIVNVVLENVSVVTIRHVRHWLTQWGRDSSDQLVLCVSPSFSNVDWVSLGNKKCLC